MELGSWVHLVPGQGHLNVPHPSSCTHPMGVPLLASLESLAMAFEYVSSMLALGQRWGKDSRLQYLEKGPFLLQFSHFYSLLSKRSFSS